TIHGRRIGPVRISGPHLDDVFADHARPRHAAALERAAQTNAQALPLDQLTDRAAAQLDRVSDFLTHHMLPARAAERPHQPTGYQ
ncbi:ATP/GTP-binding protein, partial [Streptomyces sp. NPDC059862]